MLLSKFATNVNTRNKVSLMGVYQGINTGWYMIKYISKNDTLYLN